MAKPFLEVIEDPDGWRPGNEEPPEGPGCAPRIGRLGAIVFGLAVVIPVCMLFLSPYLALFDHDHLLAYCQTNEKQMGIAFTQYSQDYDGRFPVGAVPGRTGVGWAGQICAYAHTTVLFHCPLDRTGHDRNNQVVSYAYNQNVARHSSESQSQNAGATVLLFEVSGCQADLSSADEGASEGAGNFSASGTGLDRNLFSSRPGSPDDARYETGRLGDRPADPDFSQIPDAMRHAAGSNFLLLDGHTTYLKPKGVSSGWNALDPGNPQTGTDEGRAAGSENRRYACTFSTQ